MFVEIKSGKSIARRSVRTEAEAVTLAQAMAHRWNKPFTVHNIRPRDGKKIFLRKIKPA